VGAIPVDVIKNMIADMDAVEKSEDEMKDDTNNKNETDGGKEASLSFANGNPSKAYQELKLMLRAECTIEEIGAHALNIMELLQLGKIEKGSETMDLKYKSLTARWFGTKSSKGKDSKF
jgi:hypothetical protein